MKNIILKLMISLSLVIGFSGCLSEDEKKAKEIMVEKIIEDKAKEEHLKRVEGKFPDLTNINKKINERTKKILEEREKKQKKQLKE